MTGEVLAATWTPLPVGRPARASRLLSWNSLSDARTLAATGGVHFWPKPLNPCWLQVFRMMDFLTANARNCDVRRRAGDLIQDASPSSTGGATDASPAAWILCRAENIGPRAGWFGANCIIPIGVGMSS